MRLRQTHSIATLPISREAYTEIAQKLLAAGYAHALLIRHNCNYLTGSCNCLQEQFENGTLTIDMHGIGLVLEQEEEDHCVICDKPCKPNIRGQLICGDCASTERGEVEVDPQLEKRDKHYNIKETEVDFNVVFPEGKDF